MTEERTEPENTGGIQDGKFKPGQSGNPKGKPPGTLHRATQAAMALLEGETESLTRKAVELALEGDTTALRLCLERIAPALKTTAPPVSVALSNPGSLTDTAMDFLQAAASGELPPDLAAQLVSAVAGVARVEEMEQIKQRLGALERAIREQTK